jgi:hypothetical protein
MPFGFPPESMFTFTGIPIQVIAERATLILATNLSFSE